MSEVRGHQVADDVFVFTGTAVNWVLIREGSELTLVDAGWRGDTEQVERSIRSLGREPQDLRAVVLTHAHADHSGALNHLHDTYGVPLYMDSAEVPNAVGTVDESGGPLDVAKILYRPRVALWAAQIVGVGALRHVTVPDAQAFPQEAGPDDGPDDGALDLPGRPVPVATPGHTSGHTSYLLPSAGVLISGDALVTAHPTLPDVVAPRLLPGFFSNDQDSAVRALSTLRTVDADTLVPGHGPTWHGPISRAVDEALDHVSEH
ncbi:MBL fold hydrolase [Actinomycetospora sp. NBRC 106375]|uniref:MBL fold metallo-hydrolase n=1 Tax=Actinomycetospora sp. NBRC 106375 TaxID=3032207 RepID=UPI0024A26F16|nr:MBL fold metallo-hydrolase [Actinomycetospora sp. NBRC 106375]GLZ49163.1 MBL fold hydrolase [Actinomycetospora sp. NBRC 106375]